MGTGEQTINPCIYNHVLIADPSAIPSINRAFRYGDGFFESILNIRGNMPLWQYHLDRLHRSVRYIFDPQAPLLDENKLLEHVQTLCNILHNDLVRLRLTCWRKGGGTYRSIENDYDFLLEAFPLEKMPLSDDLMTYGFCPDIQKPRIPLSNYKTNSSLYFVMAQRYAQQNQWQEVILMNTEQRLCEGSYQNIFIIQDGIFYTPPLSEGCIDGSSRRFLIDLMQKHSLPFEEKPLSREDAEQSDALFFTNGILILSPGKYDEQGRLKGLMKMIRSALGLT